MSETRNSSPQVLRPGGRVEGGGGGGLTLTSLVASGSLPWFHSERAEGNQEVCVCFHTFSSTGLGMTASSCVYLFQKIHSDLKSLNPQIPFLLPCKTSKWELVPNVCVLLWGATGLAALWLQHKLPRMCLL